MTDNQKGVPPVTLPLRFLHAYLAGRIPFLQFCRSFEWADEEVEAQGANPFFRHERDNLEISSIEITDGDGDNPLVTFFFQPESRA
ncbi:MAG: hypothetical protein REJ23_04360 [Brevundimonas sp.]|nr:hypothetical protein [Brevundimonas sp.]